MERINDISFEIAGKVVVLIEHQSTINPNMALRLLLYIARIYEKNIDNKTLYSGKKMAILRPEFFVLYNGTAPYPDETVIRLSDSFEQGGKPGMPGSDIAALELMVKVYNINEGRNGEIIRRSERLRGYSAFIAKVREYEAAKGEKEAAMREAVRYCMEHDILKDLSLAKLRFLKVAVPKLKFWNSLTF
jgi:hypothetical protein